jgi:hypothetical protein
MRLVKYRAVLPFFGIAALLLNLFATAAVSAVTRRRTAYA